MVIALLRPEGAGGYYNGSYQGMFSTSDIFISEIWAHRYEQDSYGDQFLVAPNTILLRTRKSMRGEIVDYIIETFKTSAAISIAICESGLDPKAYNPELKAKALGITKYSSCGLFQNNDARCDDKTSELYDHKYSTDLAYKKYTSRLWYPWKNCATKLGLI